MTECHIVGLTGPTGSGKSTVADRWRESGLPVIDTDRIARQIVEPGSPCLSALAEAFSAAVIRPDGTLDRVELARRAFASPADTARLNAITHPAIRQQTEAALQRLREEGHPAAVIDAPLLFESGFDALCHHTIAVLAPREGRLARLRERDRLTDAQLEARMAAQPDDAFYRDRADAVIENDGTLDDLYRQADTLREQIARWAQDT